MTTICLLDPITLPDGILELEPVCILLFDPTIFLTEGLGDNKTFLLDLMVEAGLGLSTQMAFGLYY
jgi:hypothetical protein